MLEKVYDHIIMDIKQNTTNRYDLHHCGSVPEFFVPGYQFRDSQ